MHPVLAQETIHDLSTRHIARVEAGLRRIDTVTEGAGLPIARPTHRPLGLVVRSALAATIGQPKRLPAVHP